MTTNTDLNPDATGTVPAQQATRSVATGSDRRQPTVRRWTPQPPREPSLAEGFTDPEQQLQDELSSDRIIRLRADQGYSYIENLQIPKYGDLWIPGYRVITEQLAREVGLAAAGDGETIPDDPFADMPLEQEQPASGAVDGNVIASFVDGVTGQQKIDVLNSCLLAQLAANAKANRMTQPVPWTNAYATVLMNLAWVVPSFRFTNLTTRAAKFTIDQVVMNLAKSFLTGEQLSIMQAAIDTFKALEDEDRRFVIFEKNSKRGGDGNFQVNGVGTSADNTLSMKLGAYNFDTQTDVTNVLWFRFSGNNTKLAFTNTTLVLNEAVMDRLRDAIVDKLGGRGLSYIGGLELKEDPVE